MLRYKTALEASTTNGTVKSRTTVYSTTQ